MNIYINYELTVYFRAWMVALVILVMLEVMEHL